MLEDLLQGAIFDQIDNLVNGIFNDLVTMINGLDPITKLGVLVLGGIIAILGTFSLIKKLSKLIFVVALVFGIWYVLANDILPF